MTRSSKYKPEIRIQWEASWEITWFAPKTISFIPFLSNTKFHSITKVKYQPQQTTNHSLLSKYRHVHQARYTSDPG